MISVDDITTLTPMGRALLQGFVDDVLPSVGGIPFPDETAAAIRQALATIDAAPKLWGCPDCGFTFDAIHTNADGSTSCPACAELKLTEELAALRTASHRQETEPVSSIDYQQRRGVAWDIIDQALETYNSWLLDDDYEAPRALEDIITKMRERKEAFTGRRQETEGEYVAKLEAALGKLLSDGPGWHAEWCFGADEQEADCNCGADEIRAAIAARGKGGS